MYLMSVFTHVGANSRIKSREGPFVKNIVGLFGSQCLLFSA